MDRSEFLRMTLETYPEDITKQYNLLDIVDDNSFVIIRVEKGMYRLPYTGVIAQQLPEKRLKDHSDIQSDKTPGFWKHKSHSIFVSLFKTGCTEKEPSTKFAKFQISKF